MHIVQKGFSLIELMIAVAIVGILAAIAGSSYSDYVVKSNRVECQTAMKGLASALERHRAANGTYASAVDGGGNILIYSDTCPIDGGNTTYTLTLENLSASTYRVVATAEGRQLSDGGGDMELDHTGVKRWDRNRDGDFTDSNETSWSY